jgi:clan AA aspartic protease (TIGR02281 family)
MKRLTAAAALAIAAGLLTSSYLYSAKAAGSDMADGMSLYSQKNYRAATLKFESAMKTNAANANVVYYCALANQMSNNRARARQLYEYIGSSFPGSKYAAMASSALSALGGVGSGGSSSNAGSGTVSGGSSPVASGHSYSGPSQFSVPFTRGRYNNNQGGIYLEVLVNNHAVTFHLDTGAGSTVMGANQLEELGLSRPPAGEKGFSSGVGERDKIPTWGQKLDLKVGNIYMRDFQVSVHDHYEGEPLLGRDFLADWDVSVDEANRQVTFNRKGTQVVRPSVRGILDVPFVPEGRHMVVDGIVNGRPYKFYFDTGADSVCFSMNDMKKLGLEDNLSGAKQGYSTGVGGQTKTWMFPINSLKVGPLSKENFEVSVVENSAMSHPLLGQSFFGSYSFNIDEVKKVIHFKPNN